MSDIQSTLSISPTPFSAPQDKLPDVVGWPLDEARAAIETILAQHGDWQLRVVETAPPIRAPKPARPSKPGRQTSDENKLERTAPALGMWRVLRCRVSQSTLENIGPETGPIVELVVAREIVAVDTSFAPSVASSHSI